MKTIVCLTLLALTGCAQPMPQVISVPKPIYVYPPEALYAEDSPCQQLAPRKSGTVADLGVVATVQHYTIQDCLDDRAALRQWHADTQK